jgi:ubiquinone/menaquinone biosynthesis C-methylase UbiE
LQCKYNSKQCFYKHLLQPFASTISDLAVYLSSGINQEFNVMGLFQWLTKGRQNLPKEQAEQRIVTLGERGYIEDAPYMFPKDDQEIDRLDLQHYVLRFILHENYLAPLKTPGRILDVGCGSGRWAIEMAEAFPTAEIVGLDIIKPTPDASRRPANVLFLQRDILKGLPFTDHIFDYVHMRFLIGALPIANFQNVINELNRVVRPGGWIELTEPGVIFNAGAGLDTMWKWLLEFARRRGIDTTASTRLDKFLKDAGFVNITRREVNFPIGDYAGQAGHLMAQNVLALAEAIRAPVISLNIASAREYDAMLAIAKTELARDSGSSFTIVYIATAQRPA